MSDFDLVLRGNIVLSDRIIEDGYVAVTGGKIGKVGSGTPPSARETQDFRGQWIMPGVIDGHMGSNVTKAIYAYDQMTGSKLDPNNTDAILEELRMTGGLPVVSYPITPADAAGPFVAEIPEDYSHKALLPSLAYTSTTEMLAERFHMDEAFLKEMNPGADFSVPRQPSGLGRTLEVRLAQTREITFRVEPGHGFDHPLDAE